MEQWLIRSSLVFIGSVALLAVWSMLVAPAHHGASAIKADADAQACLRALRLAERGSSGSGRKVYVDTASVPTENSAMLRLEVNADFRALPFAERLRRVEFYYRTWEQYHRPYVATVTIADPSGLEIGGAMSEDTAWVQDT